MGVIAEQPHGPGSAWRFGLAGPLIERLLGWGWDSALPAAYAYLFIPTNVGCYARVDDRQGRRLQLADPGDW